MTLFLFILTFIFGLAFLIFGSHLMVDLSLNLTQKLKLSGIAVGAIFIAIVTAMPETFITLFALRKSSMVAFGNLIGSNIINVPLAIGLPALIIPLKFRQFASRISLIMIISAAIAFLFMIDGNLTAFEGWILILFYFIYIIYVIKKERNNNHKLELKEYSVRKTICLFIISGIVLLLGAYLVSEAGLIVVQKLGISELYIGTTIIAFGSIVPEFAFSLTAAFKGQGEISIGNILGDNIFTMFVVLGIVGILKPLSVTRRDLSFSLLSIIFITGILFLITLKRNKEISRTDGAILLISYGLILLLQTIFLK